MMERPDQVIDCDVLVVGGGAAALTAAIVAAERGALVAVLAKGKAGRSGNTVVAASQFSAVVPYEGSEDSAEQHFQDTLAGGRGINDETLLSVFATRAGPQVLKLEEWGVRLLRSASGEIVRRTPPGHRHARGIPTDNAAYPAALSGLSITLPLRKAAEARGVRFVDDTPVVRLIVREGEACGAAAVDLEGERLLLVTARAVVVAAGGGGHLFANTNNTRGICGDSYGLLLEAGAALREMEFVQFYPAQMASPFKAVVPSSVFGEGAVLRNRHGERFMPLYDPANGDRATRDVMSQAVFWELRKGNGIEGEVYMDATAVPEAALLAKYGALARDLRKHGIDLTRDWVRVGLTTHFMMGGVEIDGRCRTAVPGLFAAGEATGGLHGANRLSGNALTETVVFGAIAGEAAAERAREICVGPRVSGSLEALETGGAGGESLDAVRAELRRAMWSGASVVRSESSLRSTLATVLDCARAVERCSSSGAAGAARREETRLMALAAEAVVRSALARRESRGAHFREDFAAQGDRWLGSHRVRRVGERLEVEFVPKRPQSD